MANPTSELLVKIGTDTKQLKTGLDSANKQTAGFAKNIQRHSKAIGIAMIAVGVAIVGVAAKSVLSYAKMGDEVAKMAKRTGFSAESLSELRHAAEISGAELSSLEKGVKRMSKTIVDASEGMATYIRAFDRIGISVEELMALSPEQQFDKISMAIAGLEDPTLRAATAQDIFGRAGTQLLPLFAEGTAGIAKLRQEAHDLGIVFDAEAAVKAEAMTDAMTRLKSSVKGAEFSIADALIPVLKPLLDKITNITTGIGEWIGENETLTRVITGGGGLLIGLGGLLLILPKLKIAVATLGHTLKTLLLNPIVLLIAALVALGVVTYSLIQKDILANKVNEASIKVKEELAKSEGRLTEEVLKAQKALNELRLEYGKLEPEELKEIERSQEIIALWEEGIYVLNETTGALELYEEGLEKTADATEKLRKETKKLTATVQESAAAAFMTYAAMGVMTAAQWEQYQALGGALGIPGFQAGGIVTKPTVAMVGEKGPEAIVPLDRGGIGPSITINFTEPVFMEREESMNKLADRIYRVIKREQRLSFGGAYSG